MISNDDFLLVKEFAERTMKNIAELKQAKSAYQVTQLLNSCLGLLIFPQQRIKETIPRIPSSSLKEEGWPVPKPVRGAGGKEHVDDLRDMIRLIRNALTHCCLRFEPDAQDSKKIGGLILWDIHPITRKIDWKAFFTIEDIRIITEKFGQEVLDFKKSNVPKKR